MNGKPISLANCKKNVLSLAKQAIKTPKSAVLNQTSHKLVRFILCKLRAFKILFLRNMLYENI